MVGVGYRLVLVLTTVPVSNSDEATFGLAALHIAQGREQPIFLYGQRYMGTLESYLAAPLLAVTGPSWPALRLPVLALYALFLWLIHRLTRRIGSPWFATVVVGLLALGSERVVRDQVTAVGGRPEVKVAVLAMLLVVVALARGTVRHRALAVGGFGLLAGVALWSDWLITPYLAVAGLALVWTLRRELLGWAGPLLVVGFAVGLAPMIRDNLVAPPGQDSLSVLRRVSGETGAVPPVSQRVGGGCWRACRWPPGSARSTAVPAGRRGSGCSTRCCWWWRRRSPGWRTAGRADATTGSGRSCTSHCSPARR
ncbi:hypothetical protein GCM10029963_21980 [Micromonospora andamanensis]